MEWVILSRPLPTNYEVYRQVVKAYPTRQALQLTLGVNDNSVEKAEPVASNNSKFRKRQEFIDQD
jgi:hypothetical protein